MVIYVSHQCNIVLIYTECTEIVNVNFEGILLLSVLLYFKLLTNVLIRTFSTLIFP